jgi:phage terminase small subunit
VLTDDRLKALDAVTRIYGLYNDKRDDETKALAAEKLRIENERLRNEKSGGNSNAQLLADLIAKLPS